MQLREHTSVCRRVMIGKLTEKGRKNLENADSDRDFNEFDSGRVQIFRDFTFA